MTDRAGRACSLLWRLWQSGRAIDALPPELCPETREAGYAIQACFERYTSVARYGWKIAATSAAGQAHIGVDGPIAGRLLAERVRDDGASVPIATNRMRVCEPEFAFRLARDVAPRAEPHAVDEAMDAVADLHLALELPDSRFADFGALGAIRVALGPAAA